MKPLIHQALHGYRDGHRLLASSVDLSRADRQMLAIQTDNSDAGRDSEWASLLSGYPLPSGVYAWSMTWPAPEMPRPGCVWTHTLLLDPLDDFQCRCDLPSLFRRPKEQDDTSVFGRSIDPIPSSKKSPVGSASKGDPEFLMALLWSFYEPPLRPVRATGISWGDSQRHKLLTSLWAQQWGPLRARTSFTDAPITPRQMGQEAYDLQLHRSARAQQRRDDQRVLTGVPDAQPPEWAERAARDLFEDEGLREFLHAYGPELGANRAAFGSMAEIWIAVSGTGELDDALSKLMHLFPKREQGMELKRDLLDPRGHPIGSREPLDSWRVLRALLAQSNVNSLPLECIDTERFLGTVLKDDPGRIDQILDLVSDDSNEFAVQVLDLLADPKSRYSRPWLIGDPAVLGRLISLRPQVLGFPQVWKKVDHEVLVTAMKRLRGKGKRGRALEAMLASDAPVDPALVLRAWPGLDDLLLDLLSSSPLTERRTRPWIEALSGSSMVRWINDNHEGAKAPALRLLVSSLEPSDLCSVDPEIVRDQLLSNGSQDFAVKTLVAAIGSAKNPSWASSAVLAFEQLCRQKAPRFSQASVNSLNKLDCSGWEDNSWNDKIARALNLAFQEDRWDPLTCLELPSFPFNALVSADKKAGLARRILTAGVEKPEAFKAWQRDVLLKNMDARADRASLVGLLKRLWPF